jgi:D-tyrosyl-tRNA(Tyr) deacylase
MRIVLQRVKRAQVSVAGQLTGAIGAGIMLLVGVAPDDSPADAEFLAAKCSELRIFNDADGKMNLSLTEVGGAALVVSQFTLYGDCRKGRRPSFTGAAGPDKGKALYEYFVSRLAERVPQVRTGIFGAMMEVELVNDGPVTLILERNHTD